MSVLSPECLVFSWVQTNYPTYYSKFREHADPVATFVWEKLIVVGAFIAETTKPARDYLNVKIPQLLEKVRRTFCSTIYHIIICVLLNVCFFAAENFRRDYNDLIIVNPVAVAALLQTAWK